MESQLVLKEDTPNYVHWPGAQSIYNTPECEQFTLKDELATTGDNPDWSEVDALMPTPPFDYRAARLAAQAELLAEKEAFEKQNPKIKFHGYVGLSGPPFEERGPILIRALVPGAGKTYLTKKWLERTGQTETSIIVCPWNALVADCIKNGFTSITLHELVGRIAKAEFTSEKVEKKPYKIDGVTHIHFEEIDLYGERELSWIRKFMLKHTNISYSAAGDPGQLEPIGQQLAVNSDEWYGMALAQMFPRQLTLQVSKRCAGEDRERMHKLCDGLRDKSRDVVATLQAAGLREVNFKDLTDEDAAYPHIAATRATASRVDHWVHSAIGATPHGEYEYGQTLFGVDGCKCKGGRIYSNMPYQVEEVTVTHLTVKDPIGRARTLTLGAASRFLKRP